MYLDASSGIAAILDQWDWQTHTLTHAESQLATGVSDASPADTMMATKMGGQLGMLTAALQNTQTTVDGLNTVLGSYQAIGSVLGQLNQLAVQASSSTATTESPALSDQVTALLQQLTAMTQGVTVNGRSVFAPAFTETRMGTTAPQITAITLDHYDQAEMGGTADQGTSFPLENVSLRMTIQGTNFPQPSTMVPFPDGTIDIRVPQYYLTDTTDPNQIAVHGGESYLTQAFQQQWSSTVIQTSGFGGGYGQTTNGQLTGPPPYIIMYAGQTLQLTIDNEALTASTSVMFTLPPIRPSGLPGMMPSNGGGPSGPTWTVTAAHSTTFALGLASLALPLDTTMNPLSLQTLTQFAALWNGFDNGSPPGLTPSVATALSQAVTTDLGTLGSWETTLGGVLDQAQAEVQTLSTAQTQLTAAQATVQSVNLQTATQTVARSQLLSHTSLQTLADIQAIQHSTTNLLGHLAKVL